MTTWTPEATRVQSIKLVADITCLFVDLNDEPSSEIYVHVTIVG